MIRSMAGLERVGVDTVEEAHAVCELADLVHYTLQRGADEEWSGVLVVGGTERPRHGFRARKRPRGRAEPWQHKQILQHHLELHP